MPRATCPLERETLPILRFTGYGAHAARTVGDAQKRKMVIDEISTIAHILRASEKRQTEEMAMAGNEGR
jgi:hypothetical protein